VTFPALAGGGFLTPQFNGVDEVVEAEEVELVDFERVLVEKVLVEIVMIVLVEMLVADGVFTNVVLDFEVLKVAEIELTEDDDEITNVLDDGVLRLLFAVDCGSCTHW
jgi:hypothetical protein